MSSSAARPRLLIAVVLLACAVIALVQPVRETAYSDDWASASKVQHLLGSGADLADRWAAVEPLPQIYWGALVASLVGFSYTALRFSTLLLAGVALAAFHRLCRDHGLSGREAGLLTAVLSVSPLFLLLSFTFLQDVPFLAGLLVSTLLYGRALRDRKQRSMWLASLAAAVTILVRPSGLALAAAVATHWMTSRTRRAEWRFFGAGILLPIAAASWQLANVDWTANADLAEDLRHLASPVLFAELLWRLAAVLVYTALFALPIVVLGLRPRSDRGARFLTRATRRGAPDWALGLRDLLVGTACVAAGLALGAWALDSPMTLPYADGELSILGRWPSWLSAALSAMAVAGAGVIGLALFSRWREHAGARSDEAARLTDLVLLFLLLALLLDARLRDRDLLAPLPFLLIVLGREIWSHREVTAPQARLVLALALAVAAICVPWIRGTLSLTEALWTAGDEAVARGIPAEQVASSSPHWQLAHGSFARWLASRPDALTAPVDEFFSSWTSFEFSRAKYWVRALDGEPAASSGLRTIRRTGYRDSLGRFSSVYLVERRFAVPHCIGGMEPQGDGTNWWHWVQERIVCHFEAAAIPGEAVVVSFDARSIETDMELLLRVGGQRFVLPVTTHRQPFSSPELTVPLAPLVVEFGTVGRSRPRRIAADDPRLAAFQLGDLRVQPAPGTWTRAPVDTEWECASGYERESDGSGSWYWTGRALDCVVRPSERLVGSVVVVFEYAVPGSDRQLRIRLAGAEREERFTAGWNTYRSPPIELEGESLEVGLDLVGVGDVARISPDDARLGAYLIKNLRLEHLQTARPRSESHNRPGEGERQRAHPARAVGNLAQAVPIVAGRKDDAERHGRRGEFGRSTRFHPPRSSGVRGAQVRGPKRAFA